MAQFKLETTLHEAFKYWWENANHPATSSMSWALRFKNLLKEVRKLETFNAKCIAKEKEFFDRIRELNKTISQQRALLEKPKCEYCDDEGCPQCDKRRKKKEKVEKICEHCKGKGCYICYKAKHADERSIF